MSEVEKPIYQSGSSVGKILADNAAVAEQPAAPATPETPIVATQPAVATPSVESPATPITTPAEPVVVTEPEKNVSVFKFDEFEQPAVVTPATPQTPAQPTVDWREEIKRDPKAVLKEIGFNDFAIEINEHIKNGGDPADYLAAKSIDYSKISDNDLLKEDIRKQYPTLSPSQINLMFNRKYTPAEDALEEDKEFFTAQLQADAYRVRQSKIAEQQKFKIAAPIVQSNNNEQQRQQQEADQLAQSEATRKWFNEHEASKSLMTSKRVTLNLGENGKFNFDISKPEFVTKAMTDGTLWQKLTSTKQGEPDVMKLQKIILYASNPEQFENDLVNYGRSLSLPNLVAEGQNITIPGKVMPMTPENKGKVDWSAARTGKVGG